MICKKTIVVVGFFIVLIVITSSAYLGPYKGSSAGKREKTTASQPSKKTDWSAILPSNSRDIRVLLSIGDSIVLYIPFVTTIYGKDYKILLCRRGTWEGVNEWATVLDASTPSSRETP